MWVTEAGTQLSLDRLGGLVYVYVRQAELGRTGGCHLFRHSFATALLDGGVDIRHIQAMLGHENLQTTAGYTHVAIEKLAEVYNRAPPARSGRRRRQRRRRRRRRRQRRRRRAAGCSSAAERSWPAAQDRRRRPIAGWTGPRRPRAGSGCVGAGLSRRRPDVFVVDPGRRRRSENRTQGNFGVGQHDTGLLRRHQAPHSVKTPPKFGGASSFGNAVAIAVGVLAKSTRRYQLLGQGLSPWCSRSLSRQEPSPPTPFPRARLTHRLTSIATGAAQVGRRPCSTCRASFGHAHGELGTSPGRRKACSTTPAAPSRWSRCWQRAAHPGSHRH